MWNLVVRIYDTEQRARDAVTKLEENGFSDEAILEMSPGSTKSLASAIKAGSRLGHRADFYAERVKNGRSVVAVEAPFGRGKLATEILDGCGPVDQDLGLAEEPAQTETWSSAPAPLSEALGMPVLSRQPAPLSEWVGMPTLSRKRHYLTSELANPNSTLSARLGLRLLSQDPTPLSSLLGLPILSPNRPKSSSLGMKLLSDDPTPLSSALGLKVLSRDPTPLSSALGWAALTRQS